jgi:hypothetical protein
MSTFRNSPLERGASSTLFKSLEEAGCVARESVLGLDKMLKLVTFVPGKKASLSTLKKNSLLSRWKMAAKNLFSCKASKIVV